MVWLKKSRALGKQDKKNLFKKSTGYPLDKPTNLWYNKYVSERDKELHFT
jgi:hypothetical protein